MKTVLISGGTGLIGSALTEALTERGFRVNILTRDPSKHVSSENKKYVRWNPQEQQIDEEAVCSSDAVINLAGASVIGKRWTSKRKQEILDSRVDSGRILLHVLQNKPHQVKTMISASAIGWYGEDDVPGSSEPFRESDKPDDSFLGKTCEAWEKSVHPVSELGIRLTIFRIGIVFSNEGGAFKKFTDPIRAGIAPVLGSGKQVISWIHIDDLVRMMLFALDQDHLRGIYNAVAPDPVSNQSLMMRLAKKIKGSFFVPVPVPSFILKLMMGEASIEVLKSASVSSEKIIKAGFIFQYPDISSAISQLIKKD